jgi:dolichol kinase
LSTKKGGDDVRRAIHFAFVAPAFFLNEIGRPAAVAIAGAALLYNALLAPRLGLDRAYRRPGEGHFGGLVTYPLAVLLLVALLPLPLAAGAWAVLAAGDPAAALVGTRVPRPRVPWNRRKSVAGAGAGFLAGALVSGAALARLGVADAWRCAAVAAAAGAAAETLDLGLDDNLVTAAAAASALVLVA